MLAGRPVTHQSIPPRQKATTLYSTPLRHTDVDPRGDLLPTKKQEKGFCTKVDPQRLYIHSVLSHFGARSVAQPHLALPPPKKGRGTEQWWRRLGTRRKANGRADSALCGAVPSSLARRAQHPWRFKWAFLATITRVYATGQVCSPALFSICFSNCSFGAHSLRDNKCTRTLNIKA